MKKLIIGTLCCLSFLNCANAQNKVFKEVGESMSSTMEVIIQNDQLVGYLRFTQLEKASKDSFNYRIDIMDENLNDIGSVKFRDEQVQLQSVALEQDVLCLAYLKSNIIGTEFKTRHKYKKSLSDAKNAIMMQFITLEGKIVNTHSYKVAIDLSKDAFATQYYGNYQLVFTQFVGYGNLEQPLQVSNMAQNGFVCFYGDAVGNHLLKYTNEGKEAWQKTVPTHAESFTLHTSGDNIHLLAKKEEDMKEGGFEILNYNTKGQEYKKHIMKDKQGNSLRVLSLGNDPVTGKPYLSGYVINPDKGSVIYNTKQLSKGPYIGVFTMNLENPAKGEVEELYSYWGDGSKMPNMSKKGYDHNTNTYTLFSRTFRDNEGNTFFVGSAFDKKTRWGTIVASTLVPPLGICILPVYGTQKSTLKDVTLMRLDTTGNMKMERPIHGNGTIYYPAKMPMGIYNSRRFIHISNSDTKTNYLVINDTKNIIIYNVEQKKTARTIPHKKGNLYYNVMPAKEGHLLVTQYDSKARTTRYSIEAL
jgi:hypothetical protein